MLYFRRNTVKRSTVTLIIALSLAGCGSSGGSYSSGGQSEDEQAASLLLLGLTAFGDGYTSARSHRVTCTSIAGITTCD